MKRIQSRIMPGFKHLLLALIACAFSVSQACACIQAMPVEAAPAMSAEHSGHAKHMSHDAQDSEPCHKDCPHCFVDHAFLQSSIQDLSTIASSADMVGSSIATERAAFEAPLVPQVLAALGWLDPPSETPVSLKVRLLN